MLFVGCSQGDDLLLEAQQQLTDNSDSWGDGGEVSKADLIGSVPIQFASFCDADGVSVDVTRASIRSTPFNVDRLGVFCLSRKIIDGQSHTHSWTGPVIGPLNDVLNVWEFNAPAHIEAYEGGSTGNVVWDNPDDDHYYPSKEWFGYNLSAYSPRSEFVSRNQTNIKVYIPVDGNDDVVCAVAEAPRTSSGDAVNDEKYYSSSYFRYFENHTENYDPQNHLPYFMFNHLMSKLIFNLKFSEEFTQNDTRHEFHVDSIYFENFPNLMALDIARRTGDVIATNIADRPFVKDANAMPKTAGEFTWPELTTYYGNFWLRDVDDSSIAVKNANNQYKYVLGTDYIKVGDCILIPPVNKDHARSTVNLYIRLRDGQGNVYNNLSPIAIAAPEGGWLMGKQYNINIVLKEPVYMDTRGVISGWDNPEVGCDLEDHYTWE